MISILLGSFLSLLLATGKNYTLSDRTVSAFANEETDTATAVASDRVTTGPVGGGINQLYLVAVANFQNKHVTSVSGLGLNFTRRTAQCAGRNTTGIELWTAFGSGVSGPVTVLFSSQTSTAVVYVLRYSGTDPLNPVDYQAGTNTNGQAGTCTGGTDNQTVGLSLSSLKNRTILIAATTTRTKTISRSDPDYTLKGENTAGTSGETTRLYLHERTLETAATDQVNHTLSGSTDWAAAGLVINPVSGSSPSIIPLSVTPTPTAVLLPTDTPQPTPSFTPTASPTSQPSGTVYYVSPAGDDNNQGVSSTSPWKTISKVNNRSFSPGDKILFEGSSSFPGKLYINSSSGGTSQNPIEIGSFGTGKATVMAGTGTGLYAVNSSGFLIRNINFVGDGLSSNSGSGIDFYTDLPGGVKLPYIHIDNAEISGFGDSGIKIGSWNGTTGYKDIRITNTVVRDNGRAGISLYGQALYTHNNVYIGDVRAFNNPGQSGLTQNSGNGIVLGKVDGGTIERSVSYNNGWVGFGSIGIWAYDSNNVTIQFNESYNNRTGGTTDGGGFDLDGGMTNSIMQYNYSHGNEGAGFGLYQYPGAPAWSGNVVRYNISQDDGRKNGYAGIQVWNGGSGLTGAEIYHNAIYVSPSTGTNPAAVKFSGTTTGFHLRNNIFITSGGIPLLDISSGQNGLLFQGNDYFSSGGTLTLNWSGTNYSNLSAWRSATGQETIGSSDTGFSVNPKLNNAGAGPTIGNPDLLKTLTAYQLQPDSPMINAGLDLAALFGQNPGPSDFYGNTVPLGITYDVGSHESPVWPVATPTPTPVSSVNLLTNPGFELDTNNDNRPDYWTSNSKFTRSNSLVHSGNFSGKHFSTSDSSYTISQTVQGIAAERNYNFSGWINIPPTSDSFTFKIQVQWKSASGSTLSTKTLKTYSVSTNGWNKTAVTLTAPAGTATAQVRMSVSSLKAAIYSDDFSFN